MSFLLLTEFCVTSGTENTNDQLYFLICDNVSILKIIKFDNKCNKNIKY